MARDKEKGENWNICGAVQPFDSKRDKVGVALYRFNY